MPGTGAPLPRLPARGGAAPRRAAARPAARPRLLAHPERDALSIAHVDCDAFFAAIEKRDDPSLADKPVIIGGGKRGVVSTACYIARTYGVRSAMPMFKALKACPDAVVIQPNMEKYRRVGREVRALMLELTPLVEPLSIDEAFLDLSGTERLHHASPAVTLVRFAQRVEDEIGITVSVGLSHNKFLAKIASDLDKPRGFSVIGRAETAALLGGSARRRRAGHRRGGAGAARRSSASRIVRHLRGDAARRSRPAARARGRAAGPPRERRGRRGRCARSARRRASRPKPPSTPISRGFEELRADPVAAVARGCRGGSRRRGLPGGSVVLKLKDAQFRLRTRTALGPAADAARRPAVRARRAGCCGPNATAPPSG